MLNVSVSLLEHDPEFLQVCKKGIENGKRSLRRIQWEPAGGKDGEVFYDKNCKVLTAGG